MTRPGALPRLVALLLVLLAGCRQAPPDPPPSAAERMSAEASARIQEGKWSTAEDLLLSAIRRAELYDDLVGQGSAWSNAGVLLLARGRPSPAVTAHRRAADCFAAAAAERNQGEPDKLDTLRARAKTNLALALIASGELDDADQHLSPLSVQPPTAEELERARKAAKKRLRAQRRWERRDKKAAALQRSHLEGWHAALHAQTARATLALQRGEPAEAQRLADETIAALRAVEGEPGVPTSDALGAALAVRGVALHQQGEDEAARASFEAALQLDRRSGDPAAVQQHLGWLASLTSGALAAGYFIRRARVARQLEELDAAAADLDAAARQAASPPLTALICAERQLITRARRRELRSLEALVAAYAVPSSCAPASDGEATPP